MAASEEAWKASNNIRDHFEVTSNGNNSTWKCKWCPSQFNGSATRAYNHLTGQQAGSSRKGTAQCPAVSEPVRQRLIAAKTQANAEKESRKRRAEVTVNQLERDQAFGRVTLNASTAMQAPVSDCATVQCYHVTLAVQASDWLLLFAGGPDAAAG